MSAFFVGVDLGQVSDYTAVAIAEQIIQKTKLPDAHPWEPGHILYNHGGKALIDPPHLPPTEPKAHYHLRHLQRWPLKTPYPAIVANINELVSRPEIAGETTLAIDHTGVGVAVVDMLEDANLPCPLYPITIHAGVFVVEEGGRYRVPKRDLITLTQVLLQNERLKIAKDLKDAGVLTKELLDYRLKIDPTTAHDSYNAREGAHDDLVLAVALACWVGEKIGAALPRVRRF